MTCGDTLMCARAALLLWLLAIAFPFYSLINSIIGALTASMVRPGLPVAHPKLCSHCLDYNNCASSRARDRFLAFVMKIVCEAPMAGAGVLHPACFCLQPVLHAQRLSACHGPQAAPQVSGSPGCPLKRTFAFQSL